MATVGMKGKGLSKNVIISLVSKFSSFEGQTDCLYSIFSGGYMVYFQNPAYIKQILVSDSTKFQRPEFFKNILQFTGRTLFSSDGKEHAMQRKMLNPAFSYGNVQKFLPLFNEKALQLVKVGNVLHFERNSSFR